MINLDSLLKSRDITFLIKVLLVKALVFPVVMYGCKWSESEVAQSCPTLCDSMDCSLSGSSVRGIFQARVLEWLAISFFRGSSQSRNRTPVSRIATVWATREALNHKESWTPKNRCFWTVVLEKSPRESKTLMSFLVCKEIQPICPKGNQPWIVIGRTDAEAEFPVLWPPEVKNWLVRKDPDGGKDWRQEEKGTTEDEMAGWHWDGLMDMSLSKL